ncbi:MAG: amino acid adenylation domain-containing protein [Methylobacter sp.]|jgi:amino acid adenylation domain-containing protein|nr:amino acid adenylation domain-containing protein [Methylobacter sp.]
MPSHTSRIADLSKEKQALLLKRIKERSVFVNQSIGKRSDFSPCPLSFAQERLWFLAQMEPDNPFYNMAGVVQLQGNLNLPVLEQALNEVVRRHEALRTSFRVIENEARQVINAPTAITVDVIDLTALDKLQQEGIVKTLEEQEAHRVFDLEQTPLLRAALLKLDGERYVLLMTLHHIVSDEWSLRLLINEVGAYYETFKNGNPSSEPELLVQYADFAVWQRNCLQGELYERQIAYWQQHLETAPKALELPTDRPRPPVISYRGANHEFELGRETSAALIQLSRQTDTTLFAVMMAAFAVLLSRYSGQNDICIGYPIANRNRRDIENLIGFFVNTQVLRTDLSGNPTFTELLERVRKNTLDAQNNQDLPFERLVEALKLERELNRTPLFQAMLVYQNAPMDALNVSELHFNIADAKMNAAKFDLTLNVARSENQLRCGFNYSADLFDEATVVLMAKHLQQLLESIVNSPDAPVSELPLLTPTETRRILLDWNATEVDYPKERYIHQLFEAQAGKTPDALAVVFEGQTLSYAELNARANRLAHYLQAKGVGPDVLVGICVERSVEMVVGLLGILKAGGTYLPLDPSYPQDRLEFMLRDVAPPVVLTQAGLLEKHGFGEAKVLCLDSDWPKLADELATNPGVKPMPENLAYCIYTSGSTGEPKGAGILHQGILNRLQWMQQQYRLDAGDCVLQKTPYSFDVSVWEFFWPLMTGAKLVVARPDEHKDSLALIDTIIREQITTIHFVPSMLQAFIDTPGVENCTSLKRVICSGEALPADLVARFQKKLPAELHNLYGPTEASVDVSYWACLPDSVETAIPIGRPIANISLYILDRQLNPVPVGTPGELHIGGIGLGRGYLNRPGLTAEKFIPNPFGQQGSRLYKTGDLVRYRVDGNIDYLGRIDHQVKIRGFRIELGEIEARLLEHPDIKEAVVLAREDQPGDKRLVAYLVTQDGAGLSVADLRVQLGTSLTDHMLPGIFVVLPELPLSANGKLDRRALPEPDGALVASRPYEAPQGPVEIAIAEIWQDLLGIGQVGRHDNFFELGGHSLMLVGLIEPLRRQGFTANMRMVFAAPTLAAMADAVSNADSRPIASAVPPNLIPNDFDSMTEEFRL